MSLKSKYSELLQPLDMKTLGKGGKIKISMLSFSDNFKPDAYNSYCSFIYMHIEIFARNDF